MGVMLGDDLYIDGGLVNVERVCSGIAPYGVDLATVAYTCVEMYLLPHVCSILSSYCFDLENDISMCKCAQKMMVKPVSL